MTEDNDAFDYGLDVSDDAFSRIVVFVSFSTGVASEVHGIFVYARNGFF